MRSLFDRITQAHEIIRPQVRMTPLERSDALSASLGCNVLLKWDFVQPTGSFKIRGATHKIMSLSAPERVLGVITASTGNHGMAVARAGRLAGVAVTVYVAASAAPSKMAAIKALGAQLVVIDGEVVDAEIQGRRDAKATGQVFISPYNDIDVVAGQGSLGMELVEQAPDLNAVFIALGSGGLAGGTGTALKHLKPDIKVIGVSPENSVSMIRSLEAGEIVATPDKATLSDGTAGAVEPGSITFEICQAVIDATIEVSEAEIAQALRQLAEIERIMVEGAAGVALAGLVKHAGEYRGQTVAVVLCGRNISLETFVAAVRNPASNENK